MTRNTPPTDSTDSGYTLIELLLVVLILGILATVVVFAVSDVRADAAESACSTDERSLATATENYFAQTGGDVVPATGTGDDRYEQTLVDGGYLREVSEFHDLDTDGNIITDADSPC